MGTIDYSVGQRGVNQQADVKTVQRLLNRHSGESKPLTVDGANGPKTIGAIRSFQQSVVKMPTPDGRVDPGGKTLSHLNRGPKARQPSTKGTPEPSHGDTGGGGADSVEQRQVQRERRRQFVRSTVKESATTTRIIDRIMPSFEGVKAVVISGYLDDADRFWKINYHWEYLLWMVNHCLELTIPEKDKRVLQEVRAQLLSRRPRPETGYRTSGRVGHPEDKSPMHEMDARVKVVQQAKRDFKEVVRRADLKSRSQRGARAFDLAAAPVAHPGTSKHGTGYALDIQGDNMSIKNKAQDLGATVVFDEQSHVHVEFKNMA